MSRHRAPEPRRTRRARRTGEGVHPALAVVALLCVAGLALALVLMAGSDRTSRPQNVLGDFLGPESGESVAAYAERAAGSLDSLADDPGEAAADHWALVLFEPPVGADAAAAAVEGFGDLRVATMLIGPVVSRDLPEPSAGMTRGQLMDRELQRVLAAAGPGLPGGGDVVSGLVVRGSLDDLRGIAVRPGVTSVEALPADAARGRFGVRPFVEPQEQSEVDAPAGAPEPPR